LKRLYLHIGYPKTGTTMLQSALAQNAVALAKLGVLYPRTGQINNAHYAFNFSLGIGDYAGDLKIETPEILREQLHDEVMRSGCDRIIISTEYFSIARSMEKVTELFSGYDIKLIVYLRRHDHAFESAYSQSVKSVADPPWQPNIESFIVYELMVNALHYDYLQTLRRWADHLGKDAITVRPYERSQNTPDLLSDFLATVQVADSQEFIRPENVNVSLGPHSVAAIQAVRRTSIPNPIKDRIVGKLIQIGSKQGQPKGQYLSPRMRIAVVGRFAQSYRAIATEFMGRATGRLFDEPVPRPTDPWIKVPELSQDELLDLVLRAAAAWMR
jgi:hypothetical protein